VPQIGQISQAGLPRAGLPQPPGSRPADDPAGDSQMARVRVDSPAGVLAVIPHLLGFRPASSVVILAVAPPRDRVKLGFRYDLPDPPDASAAADIAAHAVSVLARQRIRTAIVAGYGPGRLVTPVTDALRAAAGQAGVTLREVLRAEDGRYWSYLCADPDCCPVDGVPYDELTHPAAAALSSAGLTAQPDRESLARTLAPVTGAAAESMRQATTRALNRVSALIVAQRSGGRGGDILQPVISAGLSAVKEVITRYRDGGQLASDDEAAWLSVALGDLRVRDDAWARMEPGHRAAHQRLWTDLTRRACPEHRPAPAALLAFTAWQAGDGTLANIAVEQALDADPSYSMALLIADAVESGLPPSAARLPMTPEEVAESYAQQRAARQPARRGRRPARGGRGPGRSGPEAAPGGPGVAPGGPEAVPGGPEAAPGGPEPAGGGA
jgi:hypothetical protein